MYNPGYYSQPPLEPVISVGPPPMGPPAYVPPVGPGFVPPVNPGFVPPVNTGFVPPVSTGFVPPVNTGMMPNMGMGGGQQPCFKCNGSGNVYGCRTCRA